MFNPATRLLSLSVVALLLAACSPEQPAQPAATEAPAVEAAAGADAFRQFLAENYSVDMARYPYTASYRGIKTNHDQWNSVA